MLDQIEHRLLLAQLYDLATLSLREQEVFDATIGHGVMERTLAAEQGISTARIHQIKKTAIFKLKRAAYIARLSPFNPAPPPKPPPPPPRRKLVHSMRLDQWAVTPQQMHYVVQTGGAWI